MFQSTGIEMSEAEIDKLINMLDQDGDGEIDYGYVGDTKIFLKIVSHFNVFFFTIVSLHQVILM